MVGLKYHMRLICNEFNMYVSSVGVVLNYFNTFLLVHTSEIRDNNVVPSTVLSKKARIHPVLDILSSQKK